MKLSALHISDLHDDPEIPIRMVFFENYLQNNTAEEIPAIRSPDQMIASRDILHGIWPDERDPEKRLGEEN